MLCRLILQYVNERSDKLVLAAKGNYIETYAVLVTFNISVRATSSYTYHNHTNLHNLGSEGLEEFTKNLSSDQAAFGYLRMNVSNDELSVRTKFVFVTWIGSKVKILRKAKLSVHVSDVKSVLNVSMGMD